MPILAAWLGNIFLTAVFAGLAVLFSDVIAGLVAQVVGMGVNAIVAVQPDFPTMQEAVDLLPQELLDIMKLVGVDDCLAVVVTAYTIRASLAMYGLIRGLKPL
jgi:hypothetical protein